MYAVVRTGGKQYKVSKGDTIFVEKLEGSEGDRVTLEDVLLVRNGTGIKVGNPSLSNVKIEAKILEQGKQKKVIVYKYKSKTKYRRKRGHRQPYTKLLIESIEVE